MQLIGFVTVALTALVGVHLYLWWRLVRSTIRPGRVRRPGSLAIVVLTLVTLATLFGSRWLEPGTWWLVWPGYVWLAVMFYLFVTLLVLEPPRLVASLALRRRVPRSAGRDAPGAATASGALATAPESLVSRRLLLARSCATVAGVAAGGLVGYGMTRALGPPQIEPVTVALRRLPAGLDGLRIAVVSDIHLGPISGRSHTERIVTMINEQRPDLVAIVGDLVDGTVAELGDAVAPLRDLVSAHGSFFVTGNHEYYSGVGPWIGELERLGVNPLVNERVEIRGAGGAVLDLAGVNDITGNQEGIGPDYERALGGRDASRPVVLLAHQPVQVDQATAKGVDLQLSGHTHGGQLFPFHGIVALVMPAVAGLHRFGDTQLYVTRGAGFWGPPVRVGADPEITIVRLTRPPSG